MNIFIFIVITLISISVIFAPNPPQSAARFKSVKCSTSNKTLNPNITCFVKAYSRFVAKLTVLTHYDVPAYEMIVSFCKILNFRPEIFDFWTENPDFFGKILRFSDQNFLDCIDFF